MKAYHHLLLSLIFLLLCFASTDMWAQVQIFRPGEEGIFTPSNCSASADCDDLDNSTLDYCGPDGCFNMTTLGLPDLPIRNLSFHPISGLWIQYAQGITYRNPIQDQYWNMLNSDFQLRGADGSPAVATSNGDIWVEGRDGLYDFALGKYEANTQSWTIFNLPSVGLPDLWPNTLCVDDNDILWIGDYGGKIVSYDGATWTEFDVENILNLSTPGQIRDIYADHNGHIWAVANVLASNLRLYHYDGQSWSYFTAPTSRYPTNMCVTPGSKVYITTNLDGLITFENGVWGSVSALTANYFYDIQSAGGQKLWVASSDGLYYYDGTTWTLYNSANSGLLLDEIEHLASDTVNGEVYIDYHSFYTTAQLSSTLSIFDGTNWAHTEPTLQARPSDTRDLRIDPQGRPWLIPIFGLYAGSPKTVYRDANQWVYLDLATEMVHDVVWDSNGGSWILAGSPTHAVVYFDGISYTIYDHTNTPLPSDIVMIDGYMDDNDVLWIASLEDGLWRFDGTAWTVFNTANSALSSDEIGVVEGDNQGKIWCVDYQGNLYSYDGTAFQLSLTGLVPNYFYPTNYDPFDIQIDQNDVLWIGTYDGLVAYDGIAPTYYNSTNSPISFMGVTDVILDEFGRKWITQPYQSLFYFDDTNWTELENATFGTSQMWDSIQKIVFSPGGQLWHSSGNQLATITYADSIWPGDANDDGIANNFDILALGQAFGSTGTPRPNPSLSWLGQYTPLWFSQLPNGTDYAFSDTDGSGLVDFDDTLGVNLNFGLMHNRPSGNLSQSGVPIYLQPQNAPVQAGDTLILDVMLGTDSLPATEVYGLGFDISYDPSLVDSGKIWFSYTGSWLGQKNTDLITIDKDFYSEGKVSMGLSRINQINQSGYGKIARLRIIMIDDISGKDLLTDTLKLRVQSAFMMRQNGEEVPVQMLETAIPVSQEVETSLDSQPNGRWNIEVDGTHEQLIVEQSAPTATQGSIQLIGLDGKVHAHIKGHLHRQEIPLSHLANGLYILQIQTPNAYLHRKFFWIR
ncbi:MAG: hypothetical protein AAFW00_02645 [Bacteroidota bacterium]